MVLAAVAAVLVSGSAAWPADDCHVGSYRFANGAVIDLAPTDEGTLRWRMFDGTVGTLHPKDGSWTSTLGWTDRPDGHAIELPDCARGKISFDGRTATRIAFDVTETTFIGRDGVKLKGRLVLPKGADKVAIVVLVHGSEDSSAVQTYSLQRLLPAEGVGAFVYDKRGTGGSEGKYTQDFDVLADDAVAAMREARRLAGARAGRVGYQGGSQGGWIVPLAANRAPVDFAIVSFGLAVTVLQEDEQETVLEMKLKHHSDAEIAKALEVEHAVAAMVADAMAGTGSLDADYAAFDAVRTKYRGEPWFKDLHGNFMHFVLPLNKEQLEAFSTAHDWHTPMHYEPVPTLQASTTQQLWILGSDDLDAPSAETSRRIKTLIHAGEDFTLALNPRAEHGMTEYELDAKGDRVSTRYSPGYFAMMRDFARDGVLHGSYGRAEITRPRGS
ncbi:MAG: alpha/beta hydrolase [Alphaproteobacteria bacterium]|nr:alpha/beta hydrolase [Alphaproteobacteria bacterium]MBL7096468.1 alpha/beta hydrolase [Alphaproteobacteria bacterium]